MITIGILALQGGYLAHQRIFSQLNIKTKLITRSEHLANIDALVIPGGESSTIIKLLTEDMKKCIIDLHSKNMPIFATCAGSILLSKKIEPEQFSFGLVNATAKRNAYGRQLDSFITRIEIKIPSSENMENIEAIFIRAPKLSNLGNEVEVLSSYKEDPVLVQENNVLLATFHPELTSSTLLHQAFIHMCLAHKEAIY